VKRIKLMWNPWLIKLNLDLHTQGFQLATDKVSKPNYSATQPPTWNEIRVVRWLGGSVARWFGGAVAGSRSVCLMLLIFLLVKFHRVSREWKSEITLCRFSFAVVASSSAAVAIAEFSIHTCLAASLWLILRIALFKNRKCCALCH